MTHSKQDLQRTLDELGPDLDNARKILTVLVQGRASDALIASQTGLDLMEVARLMSKLERLGLVA